MANNIFIAAHARSGSTLLCRLIEKISEIEMYLEVFHFDINQIQFYLKEKYNVVAENLNLHRDKMQARVELIRRHREYLTALQRLAAGKIIAFKVFPDHLPEMQLRECLSESRLVVILRRNLLHSYISNAISKNIKQWSTTDTSREKVDFYPGDFVKHVQRVLRYYQDIESFSMNPLKVIIIDYEMLAISINSLVFVSTILSDSLGVRLQCAEGEIPIFKQDNRVNAVDKVVNPEEMMRFLEEHGLTMLNNGLVNCADHDYLKVLRSL